MRGQFLFFLCIAMALSACKQKVSEVPAKAVVEEVLETKIPALEAGEIFYKSKDPFEKPILLKGTQIFIDTVIFKTSEAEMIVKDNSILVKNRGDHVLMQFQLPDFELQSLNGIYGSGPDEFTYAHLVPTPDTSLISYVFESTNQKLYKFDKKGNLSLSDFSFTPGQHRSHSDKQVVNIGVDNFIYTEASTTGKSIFRATQEGDSVNVKEIFNLALDSKRKSWTNYVGDFAVNPKQNRMAYAYKYFKIIKFMDMEAKIIKTVNFERAGFDENTNYKLNGLDANITHYWGACAQDDHVYFLYSGRTPVDVGREWDKKVYYIYVEQYDWNGNPIACFKLDRWGYFTVDEKNKKLYLMSTTDDDPFFVYDLP